MHTLSKNKFRCTHARLFRLLDFFIFILIVGVVLFFSFFFFSHSNCLFCTFSHGISLALNECVCVMFFLAFTYIRTIICKNQRCKSSQTTAPNFEPEKTLSNSFDKLEMCHFGCWKQNVCLFEENDKINNRSFFLKKNSERDVIMELKIFCSTRKTMTFECNQLKMDWIGFCSPIRPVSRLFYLASPAYFSCDLDGGWWRRQSSC